MDSIATNSGCIPLLVYAIEMRMETVWQTTIHPNSSSHKKMCRYDPSLKNIDSRGTANCPLRFIHNKQKNKDN